MTSFWSALSLSFYMAFKVGKYHKLAKIKWLATMTLPCSERKWELQMCSLACRWSSIALNMLSLLSPLLKENSRSSPSLVKSSHNYSRSIVQPGLSPTTSQRASNLFHWINSLDVQHKPLALGKIIIPYIELLFWINTRCFDLPLTLARPCVSFHSTIVKTLR